MDAAARASDRTMTEYVDSTLEQPRLSMAVLAASAALLLATGRIYGVLSCLDGEIGIRMARRDAAASCGTWKAR